MSINKSTFKLTSFSMDLFLPLDASQWLLHILCVIKMSFSLSLCAPYSGHRMTDVWVCIARSICNFLNRLTTTKNVCLLTLYLETIVQGTEPSSSPHFLTLKITPKHDNNHRRKKKTDYNRSPHHFFSVFRACISCHSIPLILVVVSRTWRLFHFAVILLATHFFFLFRM